jgi:hypothetical protein
MNKLPWNTVSSQSQNFCGQALQDLHVFAHEHLLYAGIGQGVEVRPKRAVVRPPLNHIQTSVIQLHRPGSSSLRLEYIALMSYTS